MKQPWTYGPFLFIAFYCVAQELRHILTSLCHIYTYSCQTCKDTCGCSLKIPPKKLVYNLQVKTQHLIHMYLLYVYFRRNCPTSSSVFHSGSPSFTRNLDPIYFSTACFVRRSSFKACRNIATTHLVKIKYNIFLK